uniref:Uncharacterized protein n=1 Tax=Oryza sativa subsp. japonica TaxID=39947 RepID=Q69IS5_ORYSJ|nr:hypothetical protein [Oryza sativa Japonica Group]BAD62541.1 hypothetical protein [Oryza sativa Japonica Group]
MTTSDRELGWAIRGHLREEDDDANSPGVTATAPLAPITAVAFFSLLRFFWPSSAYSCSRNTAGPPLRVTPRSPPPPLLAAGRLLPSFGRSHVVSVVLEDRAHKKKSSEDRLKKQGTGGEGGRDGVGSAGVSGCLAVGLTAAHEGLPTFEKCSASELKTKLEDQGSDPS